MKVKGDWRGSVPFDEIDPELHAVMKKAGMCVIVNGYESKRLKRERLLVEFFMDWPLAPGASEAILKAVGIVMQDPERYKRKRMRRW